MTCFDISQPHFQTLFKQSADDGFKKSRSHESDNNDLAARASSLEAELASLASEAATIRDQISQKVLEYLAIK